MVKLKLLLLSSLLISVFTSNACDDAYITFNGETDNGDGTFTYDFTFCPEFLGLEGNPEWFAIEFSGGTYSSIASFTPPVLTTTTNDNYNGAINGNSVRWTCPTLFPSNGSSEFCNNVTITTNGQIGQIIAFYHDTYGPACEEIITFPIPCEILSLSTGTQTACDPVTNFYTQEVIMVYTSPPGSGTIDINGQSFAITGSPQTETLIGLAADGNGVTVTASFSDEPFCTFTDNILFIAPSECSPCEVIDLTLGVQSPCDPVTNLYTQEIIVTYSNDPGSGTLDLNGQSFSITTSPQTITLTSLLADGNSVNVTANFSADPGCTLTSNSLFTAPMPCSCAITNMSGTPGVCDPLTNTYSADITVTYSNNPGTGTLNVNGQSFSITASPQTVALTGLVSDGNLVDVTANFSADPTCALTSNSLFTAPSSCTVGCNANAGTISQ